MLVRSQENTHTVLPVTDNFSSLSDKELLYEIYDLVKNGILRPDKDASGFNFSDEPKAVVKSILSPDKVISIYGAPSSRIIYIYINNSSANAIVESVSNRKNIFKAYSADIRYISYCLSKFVSAELKSKSIKADELGGAGREIGNYRFEISPEQLLKDPDVLLIINCFSGKGLEKIRKLIIYRFNDEFKIAELKANSEPAAENLDVNRIFRNLRKLMEDTE